MNDKELLELAALAVGIKNLDWRNGSQAFYYDDPETGREEWYPLSDKAQCLQMEINLKLDANFDHGDQMWIISCNDKFLTEHQDRQRASTMAAAAIGKSMKKD